MMLNVVDEASYTLGPCHSAWLAQDPASRFGYLDMKQFEFEIFRSTL